MIGHDYLQKRLYSSRHYYPNPADRCFLLPAKPIAGSGKNLASYRNAIRLDTDESPTGCIGACRFAGAGAFNPAPYPQHGREWCNHDSRHRISSR
jgi:hypothetical protein